MKKYINYFIVFVVFVGLFAITGCGSKDKEEVSFEGTYKSDDSGELVITKENDSYKANITLFRLANFDNCTSENVKENVLTINCNDYNESIVKFTFDYSTKKLAVIESSWDLLNTGDTFDFNK